MNDPRPSCRGLPWHASFSEVRPATKRSPCARMSFAAFTSAFPACPQLRHLKFACPLRFPRPVWPHAQHGKEVYLGPTATTRFPAHSALEARSAQPTSWICLLRLPWAIPFTFRSSWQMRSGCETSFFASSPCNWSRWLRRLALQLGGALPGLPAPVASLVRLASEGALRDPEFLAAGLKECVVFAELAIRGRIEPRRPDIYPHLRARLGQRFGPRHFARPHRRTTPGPPASRPESWACRKKGGGA